ncbi:hypothetical protein PV325_012216 [Microctonus aethiopoides]|nr:hypothetical protein PV325_012216 [Microctonus aethiopoides]
MCLQKWNEESLSKFRAGVVNCLVATDVLDEGIDIPSCSLMIRYDAPLDFRELIGIRLAPLPEDMKQILYATEIEPFCVIDSKGMKSFVTDVSAISLINRGDNIITLALPNDDRFL